MIPEPPFRIQSASTLGAAIRHYRRRAGLTQAQLADRTGLDRTYLTRLERGSDTEQLRRIMLILRELGVEMTLRPREDA